MVVYILPSMEKLCWVELVLLVSRWT